MSKIKVTGLNFKKMTRISRKCLLATHATLGAVQSGSTRSTLQWALVGRPHTCRHTAWRVETYLLAVFVLVDRALQVRGRGDYRSDS